MPNADRCRLKNVSWLHRGCAGSSNETRHQPNMSKIFYSMCIRLIQSVLLPFAWCTVLDGTVKGWKWKPIKHLHHNTYFQYLTFDLYICRLQKFQISLYNAFKDGRNHSIPVDKVREAVVADCPLSDDEFLAALKVMMDENKIMVANQTVFLI